MPKKRKRPQFPQLSVLSMNRKELLWFVEAVGAFHHNLSLFKELMDRLHAAVVSLENRSGRVKKKPASDSADVATEVSAGGEGE